MNIKNIWFILLVWIFVLPAIAAHADCEDNVRAMVRSFDPNAAQILDISCANRTSDTLGRAGEGIIEIARDKQHNRRIIMHEVLHAAYGEKHRRGDCIMDEIPGELKCPNGMSLDEWYKIIVAGNAGKYQIPKSQQWKEIQESCLKGIQRPQNSFFPFVYEAYCGCVADYVMDNVPHRNYLQDPQYRKPMEKIIDDSYDHCNEWFEEGQKNAEPYTLPKPRNRGGRE